VKVNAKNRVSDVRPYVERALRDEEVRENVKNALAAAREAYYELFGARGATAVATRVATDEDIRDNLKKAIDELRTAAERVRGEEEHSGRNTLLLITGIVLGLLFNPITGHQTREWLKDKLFGPEETFSYDDQSGDGSPAT
jgi:hypothetical protein